MVRVFTLSYLVLGKHQTGLKFSGTIQLIQRWEVSFLTFHSLKTFSVDKNRYMKNLIKLLFSRKVVITLNLLRNSILLLDQPWKFCFYTSHHFTICTDRYRSCRSLHSCWGKSGSSFRLDETKTSQSCFRVEIP